MVLLKSIFGCNFILVYKRCTSGCCSCPIETGKYPIKEKKVTILGLGDFNSFKFYSD